jgi:cytochrome c553
MEAWNRLAAMAVASLMAWAPSARADEAETFFELKVRPVLAGTCVKCHGAAKASGGLRLDSRDAMLKGGEGGPAIRPGDPSQSRLIRAIEHADETLEMPPGKRLPKRVRDDLARWIADGARWPTAAATGATIAGQKHWAFEPLASAIPPADPTGWAEGPIDRFIAAGHRSRGLRPVATADRRTLIRRLSFDLTGLPPRPERIAAFVDDRRPDAYERLVDELLGSPHYGERWGRYWLDLARYADTAGDNSDYPIPQAYLYRDYVIDAFNADVPYDRFLHEQLAGDILAAAGPPEDYARRVIATGFVAQAKRFGTFKLEDIHQIIEDNLNTTGQVVLGLSLRCARCHDHKFDPVTSRDYYGLYGFFAGAKYPFAGAEELKTPSDFAPLIPPARQEARAAAHAEEVARLKSEIAKAEAGGKLPPDRLKALRDRLARTEKESPLAGVPLAYAVGEGTPTDARLQKGGNPRDLGPVVPRGVPACLDASPTLAIPKGASGRLQLARWLTESPARALTARVMVNRIWQHHFGRPIVATPSDFGLRGAPPTHPELLDGLARAFIDSGWSIKAMHRAIVLSKTYRLAVAEDADDAGRDTGNTAYWRADRRPLDAEALRDALLDLAGRLDPSRPGPHPVPPESKWAYTAHDQFKAVYPSDRRSVYLMVQRLHPHPYLSLFNGPDASTTTAVRDDGFLPLHALYLLNSPFVHEQAAEFARRLIVREPDTRARIRLAYLMAYARPPSPADADRASVFLARYEQALADEGVSPDRRALESWSGLARTLLASNEFLFVD